MDIEKLTLKDLERYCNSHCDGCDESCCLYAPNEKYTCKLKTYPPFKILSIISEELKEIANWIEENPPKTRLTEIRKIIPNFNCSNLCPETIDKNYECKVEAGWEAYCEKCIDTYWNTEV